MATARQAKRARKKANKLKGWPEFPGDFAEVGPPSPLPEKWAEATESEHAAAMTALAQIKRMRNRRAGE